LWARRALLVPAWLLLDYGLGFLRDDWPRHVFWIEDVRYTLVGIREQTVQKCITEIFHWRNILSTWETLPLRILILFEHWMAS
jgi:hypothetical protein